MNTFNLNTKQEIRMGAMDFCKGRNEREHVNQVIQNYKSIGLSDDVTLQQNLAQCEYVDVLKYIWAERDRQCRLSWLRNNADGLHAPLMYELAISEFTMNPTVDTVNQVSLPLLAAASFRVRQDVLCCKNPQVRNGDADIALDMIYRESLDTQIKKLLGISLESVLKENVETRNQLTNQKILETAEKSIINNLPSPEWITKGLVAFFVQIEMEPTEKYKEITDQYAKSIITQVGK